MKQKLFCILVSAVAATTLLTSCKKELQAPKDETLISTPLPTTGTYCRIESIWVHPGWPDQQFRLIAYDEFENPIFITNPIILTTGSAFRSFKYDSWHRLREYLISYTNTFEEWHFYGFDQQGRIGVDTNYRLGSSETGKPTNYQYRTISTLTYDGQNRIVSSWSEITPDPTHPIVPPSSYMQTWTYNLAGNRESPHVTYDNKLNLNRTNDIWMFLARDYSINNPFTATSYNSTGYPTVINLTFAFANESYLSYSQIGYGCRQSNYH